MFLCGSRHFTRALHKHLDPLTFTAPDATETELRDVQADSDAATKNCANTIYSGGQYFSGNDGSAATLHADDGTKYWISPTRPTQAGLCL